MDTASAVPSYSYLALTNTVVLWFAALIYLKSKWRVRQDKAQAPGLFNDSVDLDVALNSILSKIRFAFDADKAKIFQIHNGGTFIHGRGMKKMSLTYVQVKAGVPPPSVTQLQNLPLSMFPSMIAQLSARRGVAVWRAKDAPDSFIRTRNSEENIDQVMLVGIFEVDQLIGFISLNWLEGSSSVMHIDEPMLVNFANEVAKILSN